MIAKIAAVVVTYNRLSLLRRCLDALVCQTELLNGIIVVNNASTDGTKEHLDAWKDEGVSHNIKRIVIHMSDNTGGAGGFNEGMKRALSVGYDWIWVMDDDVIVNPNTLEELIRPAETPETANGFYASQVYDETGKHVVNVPTTDRAKGYQGYPTWSIYLDRSIVKIQESTFVSLLISRESITRVGLPIKEFFIWGDDTEYTRRMIKYGINGYLVGHSKVRHLRPGNYGLSLRKETDPLRIKLYKYLYRNRFYIARNYGDPKLCEHIYRSFIDIISLLLKYRSPKKSFIVLRSLFTGIIFNPQIEHIKDEI